MSERMEESVLQPLPVRLARRLCALASDFGSEVHISQEQLGVFVGAARESVNRQLQHWRKEGILDLQRGRILLQNMTKLTAVAGTSRVAPEVVRRSIVDRYTVKVVIQHRGGSNSITCRSGILGRLVKPGDDVRYT